MSVAKTTLPMASQPWEDDLAQRLRDRFADALAEASQYAGQPFIIVRADAVVNVLEHLHDAEAFDYLVDLTAVDYPGRPERFELIYTLFSYAHNFRLRVKARLADGASALSVTSVYPAANWLEREAFDMFGIRFDGHPNLRRILLPDEWQGHPLRKEYGIVQMDNAWVQSHLEIESGQ